MFSTPELARAMQLERNRQMAESAMARLAAAARACCAAPTTLLARIVRFARPVPSAC